MAGRSKRVIRKVPLATVADFDDQLWPINCAILILSGFVAGIAIATGEWGSEDLLCNTLLRLVIVAVAVGVLFWAVFWLQGKIRRRVQLCVLVSLLVHLWLAMYLHEQYIAMIAMIESDAQQRVIEQPEPVTLPDYHWDNVKRPPTRPDFEEPVETETPEQPEPEPLRQKQIDDEVPIEKESGLEPEAPQRQPDPAEIHRAELTAPHRADRAAGAQLSRQQWKDLPEPNEPIPQPKAAACDERPPSVLGAKVAAVARRESKTPRHQRQMFELEPGATAEQEVMKLARRASGPKPLADLPTTPTPTRQIARPADIARTEAATPEPLRAVRQPRRLEAKLKPDGPIVRRKSNVPAVARRPTGQDTPGRALNEMSRSAQLPADIAHRATARRATASQQQQPSETNLMPSRPSTLARTAGGVSLPSTVLPGPSGARAAAAAGGTAASRIEATGRTAVTRSATRAPSGAATAAAGRAEFALGSTQIAARMGQPRATGSHRPAMPPNADLQRIARSGTSVTSLAASPVPVSGPAPSSAAAGATAGGSPYISASRQATTAARGGSAVLPANRPSAGAGPVGSTGAPGLIGVAQLARVTRYESIPAGISGGGIPIPARELGRTLGSPPTVDGPQTPAATPAGGKQSASPLDAAAGGHQPQVAGLPGRLQSRSLAGAIASLSNRGAPLPTAQARRAAASQRAAGGPGPSPAVSVTVARTDTGGSLPTAAEPLENPATGSAGGVSATQGGLTSRLAPGSTAAVHHAAGSVPIGQKTLSAAGAESEIGSARAVVLAGRIRSREDGLPTLAGERTAKRVGRSTASGDSALARLSADVVAPIPGRAPGATTTEDDGRATEFGGPSYPVSAIVGRQRAGARLPGELVEQMPVPGARIAGPGSTTPGTIAGPRRLPRGDDKGPSLSAQLGGGPLSKTLRPGLPHGLDESLRQEPAMAAGPSAEPAPPELAAGLGTGEPQRRPGGLPVQIAASEGPGGLSYDPSPQVGIPSRRARAESEIVHTIARRFLVGRSGGRMAVDGRVHELPSAAFRRRAPGRRAEALQTYGGSEGTERAVEMGLDFLARNQFPDGHWSLDRFPKNGKGYEEAAPGRMQADSAATGLALLAFLGAGYTHQADKHRAVVGRGLDWLVNNQKPSGDLFTGGANYAWFYSHGIATIALCEAYGMTHDPELRQPAQKAIRFICDSQHPTRGGWRYKPQLESDTSVAGWQLMALKSAQMAGLQVPKETLEKVSGWLDRAQKKDGARYVYNPYAGEDPRQSGGRRPNLAMTAEGTLMRMYLGWRRDNPALVDAAEWFNENPPEPGTRQQPTRDVYYWYYATQVMFQMQGQYWEDWNDRLQTVLESGQQQEGPLAGSWHPTSPIRDRWGHAGGRLYVTTMNLLMLEVYYRHLPLFQPFVE